MLNLRLRVKSAAQRTDDQFGQGQNERRTVGKSDQTRKTFGKEIFLEVRFAPFFGLHSIFNSSHNSRFSAESVTEDNFCKIFSH